MRTRTPVSAIGLLTVASILLVGCGSAAKTSTQPTHDHKTMSMAMSSTAAAKAAPSTAAAKAAASTAPPLSDAAKMICANETRDNMAAVLAVPLDQKPTATWKDGVYTCTYRVRGGPIVLSVHESSDAAAATKYTANLRRATPGAKTLTGLDSGAFGTADGVVVLQKNNDTLRVDMSGLHPQAGLLYTSRKPFAYGIATVILACWTGE